MLHRPAHQLQYGIADRRDPAPSVVATAPGQQNRMSWERLPATGEILVTPGEDEVLQIAGDSIQAIVTAHPT